MSPLPAAFHFLKKIWLTDDAVWIRTAEGKEACEFFADYPRLKFASPPAARLSEIYTTLHTIGEELLAIPVGA